MKGGIFIYIKRKSRWTVIFTLVILLLPICTIKAKAAADDISGHWAEGVIQEWLDKNLAKGYADGTFRPNNPITRAEFMKLANSVFGFTAEVDIDYIDVEEGQWFYDTVRRATAAGYIEGYGDKSLRPNNPITREEVATIIAKIMKLELEESKVDHFKDEEEIKWSRGFVGAVVSKAYMQGYPNGSFKPKNNITRAEAVYALNNILKEQGGIRVIAKQDFFGITYIHVIVGNDIKPLEVLADGIALEYDREDGRWKGTRLDLEIGDVIEILIKEEAGEERLSVTVKEMEDI